MTRTNKKEREWYSKELKCVRRNQRRSYRFLNKTRIRKGNYEYEKVPKTQGWLTW